MNRRLKIGFVLLSPASDPIPSTRVAALNMLPRLRAAGCVVEILYDPPRANEIPELGLSAKAIAAAGFDIVCFQKVHGPAVENLAHALAKHDVRTVYIVCDLVQTAMTGATDATVVVTDFLKSQYPPHLQHKVHVVHDGIERPAIRKTAWSQHVGSARQPLRAVLVTSSQLDTLPILDTPPPWLEVTIIGRYPEYASVWHRLRDMQWRLRHTDSLVTAWRSVRFVAHPRIHCIPWHPDRVYDALQNSDIGIIPIDTSADKDGPLTPGWKVKSENRLTLKMAMGLPVIATPIPAYLPVIEQGVNGFLARDHGEWLSCLETLRDPKTRQRIGESARASVLTRYSQETQAIRLLQVIQSIPHQ